MRAAFAIAALAGSAFAAPSYGAGAPSSGKEIKYVEHVEVVTVVETVYVTEGYEAPKPTPTPEPVYSAPAVTTVVVDTKPSSKYEAPAYTPAPQPEQPKPTPTPTPTPTPAPAPVSDGYMGIVEEWRGKLGLSALTYDSKLESNAMDTVVSSNGQMIHKLNPGSFAQVLAPGGANEFEHVFVGGWLCERPDLPGLDGVCQQQSQGWSYQGQTGHADILVNTAYKKIGCALAAGIWCCDLA